MQFLGLELFPILTIELLNGWILLIIFYIFELVLVLSFPKGTRKRLFEYDHSKWIKRHRIIFIIGKTFALPYLILLALTPLKMCTPMFYFGMAFYIIGLTGFIVAITNFRNTPVDKPVTRGLYRYSRNPQVLTILLIVAGIGFAVGSGIALILLLASAILTRARIIEEERACLEQYGNAYRKYMERVPRYLLIKTKPPE